MRVRTCSEKYRARRNRHLIGCASYVLLLALCLWSEWPIVFACLDIFLAAICATRAFDDEVQARRWELSELNDWSNSR